MAKLRILIDDTPPGRTQRAVLAAFAGMLPSSVEVAWCSTLEEPRCWRDAPPASARRVAWHAAALAPASEVQATVFLPGHVVPGDPQSVLGELSASALPSWTTVADLDWFVADNGSPEAAYLARHREANPDYQSFSSCLVSTFAASPSWLARGGFVSAGLMSLRPWYFAQVPTRVQWLQWVHTAIRLGRLSLADVEADVAEGLVRPSLLEDVQSLLAGGEIPACPDLTLDTLFICPEARLSDRQYGLLHSRELQQRTLRRARQEAARKAAEAREPRTAAAPASASAPKVSGSPWSRALHKARDRARRLYKKAYTLYAATLRPLIRGSTTDRRSG